MSPLATVYSTADTIKRRLVDALRNPVDYARQVAGGVQDSARAQEQRMDQAFANPKRPLQVTDRQALGQAADAMLNGPLGFAPVGMFIGKGAKTWDQAAASRAQQLEKAGADPRAIWKETGTFKGPDGMWRQEIDDSAAKFSDRAERAAMARNVIDPLATTNVRSVMQHPELNAAYSTDAIPLDLKGKGGSSYHPAGFDIESISLGEGGKSPLLHELQHAIQQREGWAKGGSPEDFTQQDVAVKARDMLNWQREVAAQMKKNPSLDWKSAEALAAKEYEALGWPEGIPSAEIRQMAQNPLKYFESQPEEFVNLYGLDKRTSPYSQNEMYRRLAGEAEARATQARMNMNAAQRREVFPLDSYDVPVDQLILRGLMGIK